MSPFSPLVKSLGKPIRSPHFAFKYTIKTVIDELEKNPDRIFNQVEIAFFWRWWRESSDEERARLTALVQNGQFHFLNAGWCMHDEATVNYRDMIVNMDLGLRWIRDHFGCVSRPHASWQIDVFGHSRANAEMMADMGFDSMYFAR